MPKKPYPLTARQKRMLRFIRRFIRQHGYPPTIREIMKGNNYNSTSVVSYNLDKLEKAGFISKAKNISRALTIQPVAEPDYVPGIPIPLFHQPVCEFWEPLSHYPQADSITISDEMLGDAPLIDVYAFQVAGNLMMDAMVYDGDIVIVQRGAEATSGDTVVIALPDGNVRIKRITYQDELIRLEPLFPALQPVCLRVGDVQVVGKVLGLMRQF